MGLTASYPPPISFALVSFSLKNSPDLKKNQNMKNFSGSSQMLSFVSGINLHNKICISIM